MDRKIRVGAVSYLNTKPLIYGFERGMMKDEVELVLDYPAKIAAALLNDDIDVGLVPVTVLPLLSTHFIISDYCIGCDGAVASVCLFSQVQVEGIKTVLLDYQSNTSVALLKLLIKNYWKINPVFVPADENFLTQINHDTAALVIGDRAFEQRLKCNYVYDLGAAWKDMTGLPFVFAAWISNKPMDELFVKKFNEANEYGVTHIQAILNQLQYKLFDLEKYYSSYIQYKMDDAMRNGMKKFITELHPKEYPDKNL